MAKLNPEELALIHRWHEEELEVAADSEGWPGEVTEEVAMIGQLLGHVEAQDTEIATLVTQVRNQAAEIEDTRAAYQLTRHQLDTHRAGQGTYEGITR